MLFNFCHFWNIMVLMTYVIQNLDVRVAYTIKAKYKSSVFQFGQASEKLPNTYTAHVFFHHLSVGRSVQNFRTPKKVCKDKRQIQHNLAPDELRLNTHVYLS